MNVFFPRQMELLVHADKHTPKASQAIFALRVSAALAAQSANIVVKQVSFTDSVPRMRGAKMHPHMRSCFAMLGNTYATNDLGSMLGYLISQGIGSGLSMFPWPTSSGPLAKFAPFIV